MIEINLAIKGPPVFRWRVVAAVVAAGALILLLGTYGVQWWVGYRQLALEKASLNQVADSYRKSLARADATKKKEDELAAIEAQLAQIGRNQGDGGQSAVLVGVLQAAGPGISITQIQQSKPGELDVTGQAQNFDAAMGYLQGLKAVPRVTGVEARKLTSSSEGLTGFTFTARVARGVAR